MSKTNNKIVSFLNKTNSEKSLSKLTEGTIYNSFGMKIKDIEKEPTNLPFKGKKVTYN